MLDAIVVGAGPYGLSIAAFLRGRGLAFRIFGRAMDSWISRMPHGMMLKSDGFASNIYDPAKEFTLEQFCRERGIAYRDSGLPVSLETFGAYGLAFMERMAPTVEDVMVARIERQADGFQVELENGETLQSRRVILAVGITHFARVPPQLAHLPPEALSHSNSHTDLTKFRDRKVIVLGGGSSALDLAGLLKASGADVHVVTRRTELVFHSRPSDKPRSWWQRIRHPQSGLGPGLRSRFFANWPWAFHYLPERVRLWNVQRALGPSGGWFVRDMVVGKVPLLLGQQVESAAFENGQVHLRLRSVDGAQCDIAADHVIAATGYKVDLSRLAFLSPAMRSNLRTVEGAPALSKNFESSIPGLYFVGIAAANSFGPLMRFAFGARFAAERVTASVAHAVARDHAPETAVRLVAAPK
jgi:thioredoxin reductase